MRRILFILCINFLLLANSFAQDNPPLSPIDCTFIGSIHHTCHPATFGKMTASSKKIAIIAYQSSPTWGELAPRLDPRISDREYNNLRDTFFESYIAPRISARDMLGARTRFMEITQKHNYLPVSRQGILIRSRQSEENISLRKRIEKSFRKWNRFSVTSDPEKADLIIEVRYYSETDYNARKDKPISYLLVWPKGANPDTSQLIWLEVYRGKWARSDTVAGVLEKFRRSVELLSRTN